MLETIEELIVNHATAVLLIISAAYIAQRVLVGLFRRVIRKTIQVHHKAIGIDEERREQTLIDIVGTAGRIAIWITAILMILQEFGVNIAPLLAGAGVVGLAVGFGAQSLVKDAVNGLFIIFENQYRVGDVVMINNETTGVVERITLRATVLRDLDGMVHHVPNGFINTATNMTMEFANVNIDIGVSYDSDISKVEKVIDEVGADMLKDEEWEPAIINQPRFLRIDSFDDSAITIKILGKTTADMRWAVAGEFRKRLKKAFDKNNIEIPFPQMVIHDNRANRTSKKK